MSVEVIHGDCLTVMRGMASNSIDATVTDPPYGFKFMGKGWDHGVPGVEYWDEVKRVMRAGAYLVAFGGPRTSHRLVCAIEDAGFEIHDSLCWLFGSGFPKHKSKLKPAHEPICLARKPAARATLLNIDACRIGDADTRQVKRGGANDFPHEDDSWTPRAIVGGSPSGRWPANVVLDEEAARVLDAQSGDRPSCMQVERKRCETPSTFTAGRDGYGYGDTGGASRFFFVAREPNATVPNDPLILRRAKAILWAWNPELASTADDVSSLSNQRVASVLSRAVIAASHGATSLSGLTGLSTSVTPSELSALCLNAIALILSSADASSREQRRERPTRSASRASSAETHEPTGTTTAMIGRSTSGGSAVVATFAATSPNSEHGEAGLVGNRFAYCAKASRAEREAGLEGFAVKACGTMEDDAYEWKGGNGHAPHNTKRRNAHPTVKPVALMRWLVRLVTPTDGLVMDPFTGSGTTGIAAVLEQRRFVGIEREEEYVAIARARIAHHTPVQTTLGVA